MDTLRRSLERISARRGDMPPPQVLIRAPGWEFEFGDLEQPFHAASVGKVMTATLIAGLFDRGQLEFTTPIGRLLPAKDLAGLPAAPGVDIATDVTVDHLLTHTSGLPDFFEPHHGDTPMSPASIASNRDRLWTPSDLLDEARRLPAIGRPGQRFHYSDTVYVLMGRIAEEATGERLADLLRSRVFEPSGMTRSSTPYDATEQPDDLNDIDVAPFWIGRHELSRARALSLDWAGGGVVGPAEDFVRFQEAFHGGQLVSRAALDHMLPPRNRMRLGIHYGAGTATIRFGEFLPLLRSLPSPVGGIGYFAVHMFYYPEQDAHVVLNFHGSREMARSFNTHIRIARRIHRLS
ncbi:beta-lactamase family protein [Spiractinospora alimapuensis]|uniref:serine hydrolase domain-containing protein n=1 Tax=Spiractinospora alimapuensis TaxID=2820884 RepID=UPI001F43C6B2|nr:serine hydrolase domain-containing protein [Spiractinospora alimapuensis]QVQ54021.1 beta-lactamase family protein [Spiractinospora alimapuensis]